MYQPLEGSERMESFSTHKYRETGLILMEDTLTGKKSWSKLKGTLVYAEPHTRLAVLSILKGSVIFLHKYAHLSPSPSVLKPVNGWFSTHMGLGELVFIKLSNCVFPNKDSLKMWWDQSHAVPHEGGGKPEDVRATARVTPWVKEKLCLENLWNL